jgi:peptide/nickel transport system permease protein
MIGLLAGVVAAWRRGKAPDYGATVFALFGLSIPSFWLGLLLIVLFAVKLRWLPSGGYVSLANDPIENARHMLLPATALGLAFSAVVMRQMRSSMLTALTADYIRTARAKGLSEWQVIGVHAFRNSLITVTTVIGLQLGALISGVVITEQIFGIPGFGQLVLESVGERDYPVVQGSILVIATSYVVINFLVDIAYSLLNPRIRVTAART